MAMRTINITVRVGKQEWYITTTLRRVKELTPDFDSDVAYDEKAGTYRYAGLFHTQKRTLRLLAAGRRLVDEQQEPYEGGNESKTVSG